MVLDEKWAIFVQGGVSIVVGSRNAQNIPTLVRGVGCRVTANRKMVTVLLGRAQAVEVIESVRATGTVAAAFTWPKTHVSIQLKSSDAKLTQVKPGDVELVQRYADAFVAGLVPLGYAESLIRALVWCDPADLIGLSFSPGEAFLQTPGPHAGEVLDS
jgi:hypothetical protein